MDKRKGIVIVAFFVVAVIIGRLRNGDVKFRLLDLASLGLSAVLGLPCR